MRQYPDSKYVQQTALALNIYLNDIETNFHFINNIDPGSIDTEKFLRIFRNSWFPMNDEQMKQKQCMTNEAMNDENDK